ncbi:hypothetical protein BZB76_4345 [Actinomadura pelletieri DSM 43383]|uniref:Uncharacterized protein n=1 Tax=Actinomadura pelletieri DSM 43383 TaxID=1120940 RepID=A0A495QM82_9ACTN|nr:hypothetical protein [Actinomadura pelletieri]RKS73643.1 hypothetical protein BZB76_4345 [Actinomadura pelletieri DSM 43383]
MSVPSPSPPAPSGAAPVSRVTLGRGAYRWPFRVALAALVVGALAAPSSRTAAIGVGALLALAAAVWAFLIHRDRLVVTLADTGLVLRRGAEEATIPVGAVDAVGIVWRGTDPVWTVWFDTGAAPGVDAVTTVEGDAAVLLRDRDLPAGRLPAVHAAVTEHLGLRWRVLDDTGEEIDPPKADALARADQVLVEGVLVNGGLAKGAGRYRDERGGTLLAVASGRGRVVLRDPHAARLLVFRRTPLPARRKVVRVSDADGRFLGTVRGSQEPSFHTPSGMLLGTTRRHGDRHVVTGIDGRESASLRTVGDPGDGRRRLERSPSAPEPLRTLTLALPLVVRSARRS